MEAAPDDNLSLETRRPRMNKWEARVAYSGISIAMAHGCAVPGSIETLDEAIEVLGIGKEDNDDRKPPKPPRGRAIRIGDVALGNT